MSIIALDLGGTKLASALCAPTGEILLRESIPLGGRTGREVGALMVERVAALSGRAAAGGHEAPIALGVAVPGIYRADRGTVWAPNIPGWDDYPLLDELRFASGTRLRVRIDSDRAAYVLGESWRGVAQGSRNAIFVAVGTGIGVGLLVDGRVLRGHGDIAGAVGWLAVRQPYRDVYRDCGCLEYHASGPGLAKVARARRAARMDDEGAVATGDDVTTAALFAAYDRRDAIAVEVLDDAVGLWGMMAANLVSLFNPEIVVFGGGVFGPAVRFLDRIRDEASHWAQPISMSQVRFAASELAGDAGLLGAARLACDEALAS